jgi:antitoxin component HigA of HigAB toxin-antitoxin module
LRSRADADAATEILDRLFGRAQADRGEHDYVQALALLLSSYEDQNRLARAAHVSSVEVLQHLASASGMKQTDLAAVLGVGPSAASMILRGERPITAEHARRPGRRFKVQPGLFL